MEFTWSETKRAANIKAHGLDFLDAASVFDGIPVSVVHTENEHEIRVISFRKASKRESEIYFYAIQN